MGGQAKGKRTNKPKRKENRPNRDAGFVGLSPQERVKLRMHEKAKKKSAEKYSVQQLLEKQAGAAAPLDEDAQLPTAKDVSVAYCSIAEIYLTDFCMEEGAADKCKEFIERALQYHHDNPEALQLMASYLFSTERNQEGREYLLKSVALWLPAQKQSVAPPSTEEGMQSEVPPYESRITTAKLLIESEEYEMAVDVLEGLLEEDDEVVQVWYLSGWVCYLQFEKAKEQQEREGREVTEEETEEWKALKEAARSYLTNAKKLYSKLRCDDQPIMEHVEQLLGELGGVMEGEEEDPTLDEDYEPCSDEEEDDAEAPMDH
ncbi:hypothetical protein F2P81_001885 [Scophthalmus maximus]|uniref:Assembly chaperone of rpl4 n=1 Tax=Scophthalmus maximus TaxID=52904 RepID=A0A6A4TCM5_SCOMX|nr:hypothetical protein F2P81_001885 [Scophthalmus maximus]